MSPYSTQMTERELSERFMALAKRMEQEHALSKPFIFRDLNGMEEKEQTEAGLVRYLQHVLDAWEGEQ